jgi:hypothetical protein
MLIRITRAVPVAGFPTVIGPPMENGVSTFANKVMVVRAGAGSVVAYNYMDGGYINGQDRWVEVGLNAVTWLAATTCCSREIMAST